MTQSNKIISLIWIAILFLFWDKSYSHLSTVNQLFQSKHGVIAHYVLVLIYIFAYFLPIVSTKCFLFITSLKTTIKSTGYFLWVKNPKINCAVDKILSIISEWLIWILGLYTAFSIILFFWPESFESFFTGFNAFNFKELSYLAKVLWNGIENNFLFSLLSFIPRVYAGALSVTLECAIFFVNQFPKISVLVGIGAIYKSFTPFQIG